MLFKEVEAGRKTKTERPGVLRPEATPGSSPGKVRAGQHKEEVMRKLRLVLLAMLVVLPFAVVANAQVAVGVGVGPAVVPVPGYYDYDYYGPPDCEWGYYAYYPYACAPYGYYGPDWFMSGVFIGAGPWYGWGGYGWGGYGRGRYGYGGRGGYGYGNRGGYGNHGGYGVRRTRRLPRTWIHWRRRARIRWRPGTRIFRWRRRPWILRRSGARSDRRWI